MEDGLLSLEAPPNTVTVAHELVNWEGTKAPMSTFLLTVYILLNFAHCFLSTSLHVRSSWLLLYICTVSPYIWDGMIWQDLMLLDEMNDTFLVPSWALPFSGGTLTAQSHLPHLASNITAGAEVGCDRVEKRYKSVWNTNRPLSWGQPFL
jgi:hypothetical protein